MSLCAQITRLCKKFLVIAMYQFFPLTVALATASILFIAKTGSTQTPTVNSRYPIVPTSETDKPICYMQTVNGTTLNLSSLCENKSGVKSKAVIEGVIYEDNNLIGRVINKSNQTIQQTRVNYEVIGENGSVIDRGILTADPPTLSPGQMGTFQAFFTRWSPSQNNVG